MSVIYKSAQKNNDFSKLPKNNSTEITATILALAPAFLFLIFFLFNPSSYFDFFTTYTGLLITFFSFISYVLGSCLLILITLSKRFDEEQKSILFVIPALFMLFSCICTIVGPTFVFIIENI